MMNVVLVGSLLLPALVISGCDSTAEKTLPDYEFFVFYYEILHRVEQPLIFDRWMNQGESLLLNKTYYEEWTLPMESFYRATLKGTLLSRDVFFGLLIKSHQLEAIGLYHFLSKSIEWEVFVKNSCWARQYTHPHMFVYAFVSTIMERRYHVHLLPYIYEILPRHFFDWKFIEAAEKFTSASYRIAAVMSRTVDGPPTNITDSRWWKTLELSEELWYEEEEEQKPSNEIDVGMKLWWRPNDYTQNSVLSYLTEDADWNGFWYLVSIRYSINFYSFGCNSKNQLYSEHWFFFLEKFLARYYLERLSHGIGEIPEFDWKRSYETGSDSALIALNGKRFSSRPTDWTPENGSNCIECLMKVRETIEYVKAVIDEGSLLLRNDTIINLRAPNSLFYVMQLFYGHIDPNGNFVESNWYSLAHLHFANGTLQNITPHIILNFETMARDTFFYIFHKEIIKVLHRFQSYLPPYTSDELQSKGLKILAANITEMLTYYEIYDFDVSNLGHENLFARRARINHKSFDLNVTIQSNQYRKILLRFYIGPKYDQYGRAILLNENRHNFIELINLELEVHTGINDIKFSYDDMFGKRLAYNYSQSKLYHCATNLHCQRFVARHISKIKNCGLDNRLILPRGWINGMPMQLFIMAFDDYTIGPQLWWRSCHIHVGERSLGYPFDRPIKKEEDFISPNMLLKDIKIFHQDDLPLRYTKV